MNTPIPPHLTERLRSARSVVVLTGAGISAESGVPTFRDRTGHWSQFKPEDLASESGFRRDPATVQSWYRDRERQCRLVTPNDGHVAIATLETLFDNFLLVTQNVDNLHRRAGSRKVVELHGNLASNRCIDCSTVPSTTLADTESLPFGCQRCGGLIRPDVIWFGERLPDGAFERAHAAAASCDVLLCVGTSGVVYPAAALPDVARRHGAWTVEINIEPSALADVMDDSLIGPSGIILPALLNTTFVLN